MRAAGPMKMSKNDDAIAEICNLNWADLTQQDMIAVAWSYYFFSVQFRENLCLACEAFPADSALKRLFAEECDTSNLSPYPGIAQPGEKMNHDEFMLRALALSEISEDLRAAYHGAGERYLRGVRAIDPAIRATSMASYEDGGLEAVFQAMLQSPDYDNDLIKAFRFFLAEHIRFDSDPHAGHGSLSRHLEADDKVADLWDLFKQMLLETTPALSGHQVLRHTAELVQA
jgi:hypothetical protein